MSVNGPTYGFEPHVPFGGQKRLGHRLARAGHRGARRLLGLEDRLRHPRSRRRSSAVSASRSSPRAPARSACPARTSRRSAGHPLIAYSIAAAQRERRLRRRRRLDRLRGDRRDRAAVRRRGAGPAPGGDEHGDLVRHRVGAARDARTATRRSSRSCGRRARSAPRRAIRRAFERLRRARRPRPTRSARSSRPASTRGRCGRSPGDLIEPLLPQPEGETPLHSRQYQALPKVYVQNSSLELAWTRVLDDPVPTISGARVAPFFTEGAEGFSIDYPEDVELAERMLARGDGDAARGHPDRSDDPSRPAAVPDHSGAALRRHAPAPAARRPPRAARRPVPAARDRPGGEADARDGGRGVGGVERPQARGAVPEGYRQRKGDVLEDDVRYSVRARSGAPARALRRVCCGSRPAHARATCSPATSRRTSRRGATTRGVGPPAGWSGSSPGSAAACAAARRCAPMYPDGSGISIVRDPWSWFASARRWEPQWRDREVALDHWRQTSAGAFKWRTERKEAEQKARGLEGGARKRSVGLISFDALLSEPETTMRRLAGWLGIEFRPELLEPTFNGRPIRANTSFSDLGDRRLGEAPRAGTGRARAGRRRLHRGMLRRALPPARGEGRARPAH